MGRTQFSILVSEVKRTYKFFEFVKKLMEINLLLCLKYIAFENYQNQISYYIKEINSL